jgi:hypothetical protein
VNQLQLFGGAPGTFSVKGVPLQALPSNQYTAQGSRPLQRGMQVLYNDFAKSALGDH